MLSIIRSGKELLSYKKLKSLGNYSGHILLLITEKRKTFKNYKMVLFHSFIHIN